MFLIGMGKWTLLLIGFFAVIMILGVTAQSADALKSSGTPNHVILSKEVCGVSLCSDVQQSIEDKIKQFLQYGYDIPEQMEDPMFSFGGVFSKFAKPYSSLQPTQSLTVLTKSPSYKDGDSISYSGSLTGEKQSVRVSAKVVDPSGKIIAEQNRMTTSKGQYSGVFPTDKQWKESGTYDIQVVYGKLSSKTTFKFTASQVLAPNTPPVVTIVEPEDGTSHWTGMT